MIIHPIAPVYDKNSEILILGSFPSVKSREEMFFYGNEKNRFWGVISAVFESEPPKTIEEKKKFLLSNKIALWDVIAQCEISGSSDSSIKNVVANNIEKILSVSKIKKIYLNGKTAEKYYNKFISKKVNFPVVCLPSTSPANAAWSFQKLVEKWKIIQDM